MSGVVGALAPKLDFGDLPTAVTATGRGGAALRLAPGSRPLSGPGKYGVLNHRRRQAQIRARHLLEGSDGGLEAAAAGRGGSDPGARGGSSPTAGDVR